MPADIRPPVCRRLDLKAKRQAGGDTEYLSATLIDDADQDGHLAHEICDLPAPDAPLGDTGLTVEQFLMHWRDGTSGLDAAARLYGRMLHRQLLEEPAELSQAWQQAVQRARDQSTGFRLEIRCPLDSASHWRGLSLSALPFELMCDAHGYLFRRPGWSTVRRSRGARSRPLRWQGGTTGSARVQVAWANVQRAAHPPMEDELFSAHDTAVMALAETGRAERLPPLSAATRSRLAAALERGRPHVLIWVDHGLESGSGLLLHDDHAPGYPNDGGRVVTASDFAATVREGQVDVALLWSCFGAGTFRALDLGVAEALLDPDRGDVAAVLAAFSALDAAAVARLSKDLVEAWAHNDGDLEAALARARARLDELSLTWARPVLFLRTPPANPGLRLGVRQESPPPAAERPGRFRWLPPAPLHTARYVDHQQCLAQLRADHAHYPVVVLEGLPGAGKTELALALVHKLRAADKEVAFIDLSGQRSLGPLRQMLGLMVSAAPFDDDAPLLAALRGRHWTLVLDNAEDVLDDADLRRDLLQLLAALRATGEGFRAVVTSRHALATAGTAEATGLYSRTQALLDPAESLELFIAAAGPRLAPAQAGPELLAPLLAALGGIARAIVLMAGQLGGEVDVPELSRRLATDGAGAIVEQDLFGAFLPDSPGLDRRLHKSRLASALNLSVRSASRHAAAAPELFDVLGNFPAGLLQSLLPPSPDGQLGDALTALLEHQLVQLVGDQRRIVMAAPVRAWAARRWALRKEEDDRAHKLLEVIHQRLADYMRYLDDDLGTPRAQIARLHFLADAANVAQAIDLRADGTWQVGDDAVTASLFRSAALFAMHGGTLQLSLFGLAPLAKRFFAHQRGGAAASVALHLGYLLRRTEDLAGARQAYSEALRIYRQIEDREGAANTLKALGDLMMRTDDLAGARQAYAEALPIYRQIEARLGEANTLQALGDFLMHTDDLAGARQAYAEALPIYRQIEDWIGEANTLQAWGDLLRRTDELANARQAYDGALKIYRQIQDRLGEANTLRALGDFLRHTDDLAGAREALDEALRISRQIEDRLGEANTLRALGDLQNRAADQTNAELSYTAASDVYGEIDDRLGRANTLHAHGMLKMRKYDLVGARLKLEAALSIYRQIKERLGEANSLNALGELKLKLGEPEVARQDHETALSIYQEIKHHIGEANALRLLGQCQLTLGDFVAAFAHTVRALEIQSRINDRRGMAGTHGYLTRIARKAGAIELAIIHASRAYLMFTAIEDPLNKTLALSDLGQALLSRSLRQGLGMLLLSQSLAAEIGDPRADRLAQFIAGFRADGTDEAEFSAALSTLREQAPGILDQVCAWAEAAVASGEIDPKVLPPPAQGASDDT